MSAISRRSVSRRYRRTFSTGLALALPLVALAACGGGSGTDASAEAGSGTGTIKVWAHQGAASEAAALQSAVKSFNSSQDTAVVRPGGRQLGGQGMTT
jgi:multiple sugar transport system substrate-binding protein